MGEVVLGASRPPLEAAGEAFLGARDVLVWRHLLQGVPVPGLLEADHRAEDKPEGVIAEASADGVLAALHQWLELVVRASRCHLPGHQSQNSLPSSRWRKVEEAERGLLGVPKAHPPPNARLEQGHEVRDAGLDAAAGGSDDCVALAVSADMILEVASRGLPREGPDVHAVVVPQADGPTALDEGDLVVPVAREAAGGRVAIEGVPVPMLEITPR